MLSREACFSLIHSFMDYVATVCGPYQKYNVDKIVRVQRRAIRFVKGSIKPLVYGTGLVSLCALAELR